ncbi:MAG: hypothetical protein D6778_01015 [Nitrospirae bacterium]|nr:MAG: hypothetical protein D6778_01015 [Nitrospirota bacterium]
MTLVKWQRRKYRLTLFLRVKISAMDIREIQNAFKRGLHSLKGALGFFGSRLRVEIALYSEIKEYERMKAELKDLYSALGEKVLKEAPPELLGPHSELIEKIKKLEEAIEKKEKEIQELSQPETR